MTLFLKLSPTAREELWVPFQGLLQTSLLPQKGIWSVSPPTSPSATEPRKQPPTCQHGDEREAVVLWAAPVASFSQHVSVKHLMVEFLDPGLGEDHEHPAGLDLLHELFLQRRSHDKVTKFWSPANTQAPPLLPCLCPSHVHWVNAYRKKKTLLSGGRGWQEKGKLRWRSPKLHEVPFMYDILLRTPLKDWGNYIFTLWCVGGWETAQKY